MNGWKRSGWVAGAALCLGLFGSACGSDAAKSDSSASATSSPKSDGSSKSSKKDDAKKDDKDAKKDDAKKDDKKSDKKDDKEAKNDKDDVDVDSLLDDKDDKEEAGALKINIEDAKEDAPTIGGKEPPPEAHSGAKLTWVDGGTFMIPNLGMKSDVHGEFYVLTLPDKKGGAIFSVFKDQADARKKVNEVQEKLGLKDFKWKQKPKAVTLGPDKIPAILGGGHGVGSDGKGAKLAYALISGKPNVLAIVGVDDDAPKSDMETAFASIAYIKKKH